MHSWNFRKLLQELALLLTLKLDSYNAMYDQCSYMEWTQKIRAEQDTIQGWTLKVSTLSKVDLRAFEMWIYRRILNVPWTSTKTSEEILRMLKRDWELSYHNQMLENIVCRTCDTKREISSYTLYLRERSKVEQEYVERTRLMIFQQQTVNGNKKCRRLIHSVRDREERVNVIANMHYWINNRRRRICMT